MVRINFDITENEHNLLKKIVGYGNISKFYKEFTRRTIEQTTEDVDKYRLLQELDLIKKEKERIDSSHARLISRIESIESKERAEELKKLQEEDDDKKARFESARMKAKSLRMSGILGELG